MSWPKDFGWHHIYFGPSYKDRVSIVQRSLQNWYWSSYLSTRYSKAILIFSSIKNQRYLFSSQNGNVLSVESLYLCCVLRRNKQFTFQCTMVNLDEISYVHNLSNNSRFTLFSISKHWIYSNIGFRTAIKKEGRIANLHHKQILVEKGRKNSGKYMSNFRLLKMYA